MRRKRNLRMEIFISSSLIKFYQIINIFNTPYPLNLEGDIWVGCRPGGFARHIKSSVAPSPFLKAK